VYERAKWGRRGNTIYRNRGGGRRGEEGERAVPGEEARKEILPNSRNATGE
jgi:hypothetical protein